MLVHTLFDLLAWGCALGAGVLVRFRLPGDAANHFDHDLHPGYFFYLGIGAILGAFLFGTLNLQAGVAWNWQGFRLGHSSAGAIAGGIMGVELYKWLHDIRISTGAIFVVPLAVGLVVGRLGCFFAGLDDFTFGVATDMPWGYDFGDGLHRHPVQLYESASMLLFLLMFIPALIYRRMLMLRLGFYLFVLWYALQRFCWEFLKPYAELAFGLNLFHYLMILLAIHALWMIRQPRSPNGDSA